MKITKTFFDDIRALIVNARATVARGADLMQVYMNFEIGRRIVEQEQKGKDRAAYGKEVIKALAERLVDEFGKGFSASNLAYMRTFYLLYQDRAVIFQTPSGKSKSGSKSKPLAEQSRIAQTLSGKSARGQIMQAETAKLNLAQKSQTLSGQFQILQTATGESDAIQPNPLP